MRIYFYLAAAVLWALSLAGVGWWQNTAGHTAERTAWLDREGQELRAANAKIVELTDDVRRAEHGHAQAVAEISANYQKELNDVKTQRDRDVAAARAGALVLRFDPAGLYSASGLRPPSGAGSGGCDGAAVAGLRETSGSDLRLPPDITADLYGLVHDANAIVRQLTVAQQVIEEDRRLCGGGEEHG